MFLTRLFETLNASGVRYAVMRNHEPLPESAGGSDVDLLVAPAEGARATALVHRAVLDAGGAPLGTAATVGFYKIHAFGRPAAGGDWWGQVVDVNAGLYFRGQQLLANEVEWPTREHRGIRVLPDELGAALGVLKEVLNNATVPDRYVRAAGRAVTDDWALLERLLAPMGPETLERFRALVRSAAGGGGAPSIDAECRRVRRAFVRHALAKAPVRFFGAIGRRGLAKARLLRRPGGKVVVILGVDGAGKSTLIDAIKPVLDDATHNATVVRHLRPTVLPPLARLKRRRAHAGPVVDPHGSTTSGVLGSALRAAYLSLDYVIGYWVSIRPDIARQPTVVLFDRYAYDMALDPRRFRIALPARVVRGFTRLAPRPDLILCLHGPPEVLAARKRELPLTEVKRQVEALRELARDDPRAVLVSTEGTVEEARDRALQALRDCCLETASRHPPAHS